MSVKEDFLWWPSTKLCQLETMPMPHVNLLHLALTMFSAVFVTCLCTYMLLDLPSPGLVHNTLTRQHIHGVRARTRHNPEHPHISIPTRTKQ